MTSNRALQAPLMKFILGTLARARTVPRRKRVCLIALVSCRRLSSRVLRFTATTSHDRGAGGLTNLRHTSRDRSSVRDERRSARRSAFYPGYIALVDTSRVATIQQRRRRISGIRIVGAERLKRY